MTKYELHNLRTEVKIFHQNLKWKEGYCCYEEDGCSRNSLLELGTNRGLYGWNWTLYFSDETMTFYVSGYRNY